MRDHPGIGHINCYPIKGINIYSKNSLNKWLPKKNIITKTTLFNTHVNVIELSSSSNVSLLNCSLLLESLSAEKINK